MFFVNALKSSVEGNPITVVSKHPVFGAVCVLATRATLVNRIVSSYALGDLYRHTRHVCYDPSLFDSDVFDRIINEANDAAGPALYPRERKGEPVYHAEPLSADMVLELNDTCDVTEWLGKMVNEKKFSFDISTKLSLSRKGNLTMRPGDDPVAEAMTLHEFMSSRDFKSQAPDVPVTVDSRSITNFDPDIAKSVMYAIVNCGLSSGVVSDEILAYCLMEVVYGRESHRTLDAMYTLMWQWQSVKEPASHDLFYEVPGCSYCL